MSLLFTILFPFNKVIRLLIISDFFFNAAFGFLAPIFAIFILQNIEGGNAGVAGIAAGIYWIFKSFLQIPIGKFLDLYREENDDYWAMVVGMAISSLVPLGFLFASYPWHLYGLQFLLAFGMALAVPARNAIFTRHIDKEKEAQTWGFQSSVLGFAGGLAGIAGGFIADAMGFAALFLLLSLFGMIATILVIGIRNDILYGKNGNPK